jgi:hypothetical protein
LSARREQGEKLARKRQVLRKAEQADVMGGGPRSSIFSLFDWQKKPSASAYGRDSGTLQALLLRALCVLSTVDGVH